MGYGCDKKLNKREKYDLISENEENKRNYISAEINIEEDDINKNIRIINSCENGRKEKKFFSSKYKNEEEIKENCKITINNIKI